MDKKAPVRRMGRALVISLVLYALASPTSSSADEFSQVSHYAARLFSYGTLVVDARMGDVHIEGWDEPRVEVEAEKVVRTGNAVKAEPLFGQIRVLLVGGDKEVRLSTIYPPRSLLRPFRDESQLTVNLTVHMPFDSNLRLKCVDGDVYVHGVIGREDLRVNYGDVEIDVPSVYDLRSLRAHTVLGYVQSDLTGLDQDAAGFQKSIAFTNLRGSQDIDVRVKLGGVFIYREGD